MAFHSVNLPPLEDWTKCPNQSQRLHGIGVRLVVVHDPEGTYAGTSGYLMTAAAQVSYHVLLSEDGSHARQFVPWERKAWSCASFNSISDNISIEGFAAEPYDDEGLRRLARVVAFRLHERRLPATFVSAGRVTNGEGFTFHSELGAAGGGHHDPGFDPATKARFIDLVHREAAHGRFRAVWGK